MQLALPILLSASLLSAQSWCVVEKPATKAIQAAIDRCSVKGGGVAYVPPGHYITGPFWLKDNVELRLEGEPPFRRAEIQPIGRPAFPRW